MADFFRKLFGSKEKKPEIPKIRDDATTAPLSDQQISSIIASQAPKSMMRQLIASVGQSVGKQRDHNEDSVLALTSTISGSTENVPFGLYIVADGMGGHQFGEVASNAAIRIIGGNVTKKFHSFLYQMPTQSLQESLQEVMESSILEAHQYIQREAPGSGTTVTAALVLGQQVTVGHVGDSRAYAIFTDGNSPANSTGRVSSGSFRPTSIGCRPNISANWSSVGAPVGLHFVLWPTTRRSRPKRRRC